MNLMRNLLDFMVDHIEYVMIILIIIAFVCLYYFMSDFSIQIQSKSIPDKLDIICGILLLMFFHQIISGWSRK